MISLFDCLSSSQALIYAQAVELCGAQVFSVIVSEGRWLVWYRYEDELQVDQIVSRSNRLIAAQRKADRASQKPPTRKPPVKAKSKTPSS